MRPRKTAEQSTDIDTIYEKSTPRSANGAFPAALALVQGVIAYEWLVSGINKLLNPNFTVELAGNIQDSIKGNPYGMYVDLLRQVVLPHASIAGMLTELGELAIGAVLLGSAILWLCRPKNETTRLAGRAACLALIGAMVLPLNYFLMSGDPLPWIDPSNAFGEGVSIDILMSLLAVPLLIANVRAVALAGRRARAAVGRMAFGPPHAV